MKVIADKIKILREKKGITQSELAANLGITRSAVNAWEMGITVPSTQYVVELAKFFNVSADYLLGLSSTSTISVDGLNEREIASLVEIAGCYRNKNNSESWHCTLEGTSTVEGGYHDVTLRNTTSQK